MPSPISTLLIDGVSALRFGLEPLFANQNDVDLHVCVDAASAEPQAIACLPRVIVMDAEIPGIDVMQMLPCWRSIVPGRDTPIVVVFNDLEAAERNRSLADAADSDVVASKGLQHVATCVRGLASTADETAASGDHTMDWQILSNLAASTSREFVGLLIEQFVVDASAQARGIRHALHMHDAAAVRRLAHSLKGSASTMGADRLARLCGRLEAAIASGQSTADIGSAFDIAREFFRVRQSMAAGDAHLV